VHDVGKEGLPPHNQRHCRSGSRRAIAGSPWPVAHSAPAEADVTHVLTQRDQHEEDGAHPAGGGRAISLFKRQLAQLDVSQLARAVQTYNAGHQHHGCPAARSGGSRCCQSAAAAAAWSHRCRLPYQSPPRMRLVASLRRSVMVLPAFQWSPGRLAS
jgi:hypothetical protein